MVEDWVVNKEVHAQSCVELLPGDFLLNSCKEVHHEFRRLLRRYRIVQTSIFFLWCDVTLITFLGYSDLRIDFRSLNEEDSWALLVMSLDKRKSNKARFMDRCSFEHLVIKITH